MWKFIKQVLAVLVALILFFLFGIFLLIGIGSAMSNTKDVVSVSDNSVLQLSLDKAILEREIENPFEGLNIPFASDRGGIGLIQLKKVIAAASTDDKIKGIYLDVNAIGAGWAVIEEIRNALLEFKTSGKFIYAYAETYSEGAYYLASVSDKIFINPAGLLELNGLGSRIMFFKGTLEKLEIKPEIFKVGDYKSAVEPFLLDKMSDYSKKQTSSFIGSMNSHMLKNISVSRDIPYKRLKTISDSMLVHNPQDALKYKVVTNVGYYDEVLSALKKQLKTGKKDKVKFISYGKYKNTLSDPDNDAKDKIAVIIAEGDIVSGKGDDESVGSDALAEEIRKARLDSSIKAVVLRINSPGGSAMASDVMWREVDLTAKVKPVVASMSDVAASGGYYIAMACTKIVAQPNSITGSIGVFGLVFNLSNFLKNKLGITTDGVKTGLFSDIESPTRELTPYEKKAIQHEVDLIYYDFTTKAAAGRHISVDSLKKLASGRVWSGLEAKNNGLVDELGGMETAIDIAAKQAGINSSYKVVYLPESKSFIEKVISDLQNDAAAKALKAELGPYYNTYKQVTNINKLQGIQARLPYKIIVE